MFNWKTIEVERIVGNVILFLALLPRSLFNSCIRRKAYRTLRCSIPYSVINVFVIVTSLCSWGVDRLRMAESVPKLRFLGHASWLQLTRLHHVLTDIHD